AEKFQHAGQAQLGKQRRRSACAVDASEKPEELRHAVLHEEQPRANPQCCIRSSAQPGRNGEEAVGLMLGNRHGNAWMSVSGGQLDLKARFNKISNSRYVNN